MWTWNWWLLIGCRAKHVRQGGPPGTKSFYPSRMAFDSSERAVVTFQGMGCACPVPCRYLMRPIQSICQGCLLQLPDNWSVQIFIYAIFYLGIAFFQRSNISPTENVLRPPVYLPHRRMPSVSIPIQLIHATAPPAADQPGCMPNRMRPGTNVCMSCAYNMKQIISPIMKWNLIWTIGGDSGNDRQGHWLLLLSSHIYRVHYIL